MFGLGFGGFTTLDPHDQADLLGWHASRSGDRVYAMEDPDGT
jgi:hypothetical protein